MPSRVHIIGGGVAGLSAAVFAASEGKHVTLYEASGHAGGRCRSYFDRVLDRRIDNGNHLVLSGNSAIGEYLKLTGAEGELTGPEQAIFSFFDLNDDKKWQLEVDRGRIPWSIFSKARRVPGTRLLDYLKILRLGFAGPTATVEACLGPVDNPLYRRLWELLAVSILNTKANEASASLLWAVFKETFGRGGDACKPRVAKSGLSETFVFPALAYLEQKGCNVHLGQRLKEMEFSNARVQSLKFETETIQVGPDDCVILAVPPEIASRLIPDLRVPEKTRAIVNGHFIIPKMYSSNKITAIIGGEAHWIFVRGDVASVTISAAESLVDKSSERIAALLWPEVCRALTIENVELGAYRIVKEKKATFAQTPSQISRRPQSASKWENLKLAGDWTATGLPATLEGAIRSGKFAARFCRS